MKVTTASINPELHWKTYMESKFLGKHHFEVFNDEGRLTKNGLLVTIKDIKKLTISHRGVEEKKPALFFKEHKVLPLLLGTEKFQQLERIFQSPHAKDWKGKQVYLYIEHGVTFGKKQVGGIRFRMYVETANKSNGPKPIGEKNMPDAIKFAIAKGMDALLKHYKPTAQQQKTIQDAIAKAKG